MIRSERLLALVATGALALGAAACGSSNQGSSSNAGASAQFTPGTVTGAGSTFAQPVYQQWGTASKKGGLTLNYQGVGSGAGIAQFTQRTVNFGATDIPMSSSEQAAAQKNGQVVHVPTVLGAVTVAYNLPGVPAGLKLDGPTIANMYLGKIKTWNDPAIAGLNPGVTLPNLPVTVAHRSDSSGTSQDFTEFLSQSSPQWQTGPGSGKTITWPQGTGAQGNNGVAAAVKQTPGAVGYVELAYALQNNFTTAQVKNKSGQFVAPSLQSTTAAGEGINVPPDLKFDAVNSANPGAYPIAGGTFALLYQDLCAQGNVPPQAAQGVVDFFAYGLSPQGQGQANQIQYASLPANIQTPAQNALRGEKCNGQPLRYP